MRSEEKTAGGREETTDGGRKRDSLWLKTATGPVFSTLEEDKQADCAVIGGGLAGLLTAWFLQQAGMETVVLEARRVGSGQTGHTTAKITAQHGPIYRRLIRRLGMEGAKQYARMNLRAVGEYQELVHQLGVSCDLTSCDTYLYSRQDGDILRDEAAAQRQLGLPARFTTRTQLPFPVAGAAVMEGMARFHPLKFLFSLADRLKIYENTPVLRVLDGKVEGEKGTVRARHIVFACHYPFVNFPGAYFLRLHQERSFVVALEGARSLRDCYLGVDPGGLSFRPQGDYLLLGGSTRRTGKAHPQSLERLTQEARLLYPEATVVERWAAQDCMSLDGLPYVGVFSPKQPRWYVATGFGKWGMTLSMAAAKALAGEITGCPEPDARIFSPGRSKRLVSPRRFLVNAGVTAAGLLKSGLLPHRRGKAPYLTPPRCPHLGCQLVWNGEEHTWECPCHGSRFDGEGRVLDGPAQTDLK